MASIYSKAPTFVDDSKNTLAIIDSYDKEIQRINQDYATAGKYARDFKSKVDILKVNEKQYFDERYNKAVDQFSSSIDLTKRGQVGQVESVLTDITNDPIIRNSISSTQNYKKVETMRNELKTNPKYVDKHRAADEFAENQIKNAYLLSDKLGETFNLTGPIITMDTDKLITDISKNIQYEEASTNFGPVNVHEKYKAPGKTISAVYQGLTSSPKALEAERNNFNYMYQTPEAKANYLNSVKEEKKNISNKLNSREVELLTALKATTNPLQVTNIARQLSNLAQEKEVLKSLENKDPFEAYLLKKSYSVGKSLEENKALKMEVDQYTKYFTERGDKKLDYAIKERDYKFKVEQAAINNSLKAQKLAIDSGNAGVDADGNPIGNTSDLAMADTTVAFETLDNPTEELLKQKNALKLGNSSDLRDLQQAIIDMPGTALNKQWQELQRKGVIFDHSKGQLASDAELKILLNLKQQFILNSGEALTKEQRTVVDKLKAITNRNVEYRMLEQLQKAAKEKVNYIEDNSSLFKTGLAVAGFAPLNAVGSEKQKEYNKELSALIQMKNASKEVFMGDLNLSQDRKGNYNINERETIKGYISRNGLYNEAKDRFGIEGLTAGNNGGIFGNNTISQAQLNTLDLDNAIVSVIPGEQESLVKLKLSPKDKNMSLPEEFKKGYAYVSIPKEYAAKLLAKKGQTFDSFMASNDIYKNLNASNLSTKKKNEILGKSLLDINHIDVGNTSGSYQVEAREGGKYFMKLKVGGKELTTTTSVPTELLKEIEKTTAQIFQAMKRDNSYTPQAFNDKASKATNVIINNNQY